MHDTIRYVAIGDSFSEGIGDAGAAPFPGWTGRLASAMAGASDAHVSYANLAVRGRLLAGVLGGQLEAALAPRPGADPDHLLRRRQRTCCARASRWTR
ncbi:hypothetical protein Q9Q99_07585 [Curtobacterium flaccumfaciens]|nr:hypothetical protein Q9Q99_07585 [Curtobacterium flaccumfaciens]